MAYSLKDINSAIRSDPKGFVEASDAEFARKIDRAAQKIADNHMNSHIVLLSGPSGSGKTTTSKKIQARLEQMGIKAHAVSLDNYFQTVDPETSPRNRDGLIDYESPFCLDMDLLNRHFKMLDRGETIHIPKFEFARQMRSAIHSNPLHLGKDEIAIFEGIHALNDIITGKNPQGLQALHLRPQQCHRGDGLGGVQGHLAAAGPADRPGRQVPGLGAPGDHEDVEQRAPGGEAVHLPLQGQRRLHVRQLPAL